MNWTRVPDVAAW